MKKIYFLAILLSLFVSSCVNEDDFDFDRFAGGSISPTLSAPFGHTCISLDSLIAQLNKGDSGTHIDAGNSGLYVFEYENSCLKYSNNLPALDLIENTFLTLPPILIPAGALSGSGIVPFPTDGNFLEATAQLTPMEDSVILNEAIFRQGTLSVSLESNLTKPAVFVIKSKDLTSLATGKTFIDSVPIGNTNENLVVDLSQYKISFRSIGPNAHNNISFEYRLLIDVGTGGSDLASFKTDVHLRFSDLKLAYAKGNIGQKHADIEDSVAFNIFKGRESSLSGILDIAGATLSFESESSLGFPVTLTINELSVSNKYDESRQISLTDNKIHLPAAPDVGRTALANKEIQLNTQNIFSIFPNNLKIKASLTVNPNGVSGFITPNPDISLKARLTIPLKGSLEGLIYKTTINIGELDLSDAIKELSLISQAKNSFPFAIEVQAYCLSKDNIALDSLFDAGKLFSVKPGAVNSEGKVTAPTQTRSIVDINTKRMNALKASDRLELAIHLSTPIHDGGKTIMLTQGSALDLAFGMKVKTQINF